ncbi:MAG: aminotransferase class V-fold PLP-dependent enzyme, partial [Runella slithyformis]
FLYVNNKAKVNPFIYGGSQERNMRGGTENVYGIIGLAKALEIAYRDMDAHRAHIEGLKKRMIAQFVEKIPGVRFNGDSANLERSNYTVLNVCFPPSDISDMLLFNLDIAKISVSGGSACSSGSDVGSHVLGAINVASNCSNARFSFGKYNTEAEIDYTVQTVADLFAVNV